LNWGLVSQDYNIALSGFQLIGLGRIDLLGPKPKKGSVISATSFQAELMRSKRADLQYTCLGYEERYSNHSLRLSESQKAAPALGADTLIRVI